MDQERLLAMRVHRREERQQVRFGRRAKLHGDMNVGHSERFDAAALVIEGIARIVVQRKIDDDLDAGRTRRGQLRFTRLTRRVKRLADLAKVPGLRKVHRPGVRS